MELRRSRAAADNEYYEIVAVTSWLRSVVEFVGGTGLIPQGRDRSRGPARTGLEMVPTARRRYVVDLSTMPETVAS